MPWQHFPRKCSRVLILMMDWSMWVSMWFLCFILMLVMWEKMRSTTAIETGLDKQLRAYNARSLSGWWPSMFLYLAMPIQKATVSSGISPPNTNSLAQFWCNSFRYCCSSVRLLSWSKCWRGRSLNGMQSVWLRTLLGWRELRFFEDVDDSGKPLFYLCHCF